MTKAKKVVGTPKKEFRVTTITLDEEERIKSLTVIIRDNSFHEVIRRFVGEVEIGTAVTEPDATTVELSVDEAVKLARKCAQLDEDDPMYKRAKTIDARLFSVFVSGTNL